MVTIFEESGPRSSLALPPRSVLHGAYEIGRVLGKGGFGITYAAMDQNLQVPVAIKEYLPAQVAGRGTDRSTVEPHSGGDDNVFEHGLEAFLSEAQTLAQFDHPNIVRVKSFFRENGTGYLVMPFYEGKTLDAYLDEQEGPMPHDEALGMLSPVLNGLAAVHEQGILHRDIKPQNVYLTDTGGTVLLDFGAARIAFGEESQSLSAVLTPGYAPFEQYSRRGHQGPWTDVYACAAMLYRMVTGSKPPEATDRVAGEPLPPPHLANPALPPAFSAALGQALSVQTKDRPQTIEAFRQSLSGGDATVVAGQETVLASDETILAGPEAVGATVVAPLFAQPTPPASGAGSADSGAAGTVLVVEAARNVRFKIGNGAVQTMGSGERREIGVQPGSHRIAMSFDGVKRTIQVAIAPGELKTVALDLPAGKAQTTPTRPPRQPSGGTSNTLWWVLGGAGAFLVLLVLIGVAIGGGEPDPPPEDPRNGIADLDGPDGPVPPNPPPGDELALAIQATESAIRAEIAAEGGVQPTSGIEALRFTAIGEPVERRGSLGPGDGLLDSGEFADLYMFQVNRANYLFAELVSDDFDAYLILLDPNGEVLLEVDDAEGGDLNAYLDVELPTPGIYSLFVTSALPGETGGYFLTVTPDLIQ